MRRHLAIGGAVLALAAAPPAARADHGNANLPWPQLMPPFGGSADVQPGPIEHCRKPKLSCVEQVVRRMTRRWRPLDRACDHRAVFALTYLRTTEAVLEVLRERPRYFEDRDFLIIQDVLFADYYFVAFDRYRAGRRVPTAWRVAFDAATGRGGPADTTGAADLVLGANAHIQRDLPYVLATLGQRTRKGRSRKPDHDGVNRILTRVLDSIQDEAALRYDRFFSLTDATPLPFDELSILEMIKSWREGAWRNAERLLAAEGRAERRQVAESIELFSGLTAQTIRASGTVPGYSATRDAYCARSHQGSRAP